MLLIKNNTIQYDSVLSRIPNVFIHNASIKIFNLNM